jgi:CRISPR-associated protein Cas2
VAVGILIGLRFRRRGSSNVARRHYLLAYDVSDDKRRTKVFETLKDHGEHVQFSVFFCELSVQELARLRGLLGEAIDHKADQVIVLDLGDQQNPLEMMLECIGRGYNPRGRVRVV